MEEKDLQAGEAGTETPVVETEAPLAPEAVPEFKMSEPKPPVKEGFKEERTVRVSSFMRRGGLFEGYEINNQKEMPFFMRVFAASALAHLVVFAVALQLPAVVQNTCETTEFTQKLCDTMYVASLLSNSAGRDFVDQPYDPTQIPDADQEVTFVTTDSFQYPEGYWALQDEINGISPDLAVVQDPNLGFGSVNGTSDSPAGLDLSKPPVLPNQNPDAVTGGDITSPFSIGPNPVNPPSSGSRTPRGSGKGKKPPLASETTEPPVNKNTTAQNQNKKPAANTTPKNPLAEDAYNKKPLYDFRDKLVEWREAGQNNFYGQFQYSLAGTIDKDGKLVVEGTPAFNGDPKMQEIIKTAVASFSDSGMLKLLKDLQSKSVKITFVQDGNQFNVKLESEQDSDKNARSLYNTINLALEVGKIWVARGVDEEQDPKNKQKEQTTLDLLKMAQLRREGNVIIIDTAVPNKFAEDMYQTYKKDLEEKKSKQTGLTVNSNVNLNAVK